MSIEEFCGNVHCSLFNRHFSFRHPNEILVTRQLSGIERFNDLRHWRQKLNKAATIELARGQRITESEVRAPDERAERIHRKCRYIRQEMPPIIALLKKILLHVRRVERCDDGSVILQITRDIAQGLRTCEITDHRNDQIFSFKVANGLEVLFRGKIASGLSLLVCRCHEVRIRRSISTEKRCGIAKHAAGIKENPVDEIDRLLVCRSEWETMLFHQPGLDRL